MSASNLASTESGQVIDASVRSQCRVILTAGSHSIEGRLVCCDPETLLVVCSTDSRTDSESLVGKACRVRVEGDRRFEFETTVCSAPTWGRSQGLAIGRPACVAVLDRRAFRRAALAPSSEVSLTWSGGKIQPEDVKLLNISTGGLACRVDEDLVTDLKPQGFLQVRFRLPGHDQPFDLDARIKNRTPASAGYVILGVQFDPTDQDKKAISSLRAFLDGRPSCAEESVCV